MQDAPADRVSYRTCPLCEATCGLEITVRAGRVAKVRGDREDVFSRGYLCPKGAALGELHHDPDRLRSPRIRDGEGFREASWEEAFERVEAGLAPLLGAGNRDALGIYLGNPNVHNLAGGLYVRPLLKALGSRNLFTASTVDQMPKELISGLLFGNPGALPVPDVDRCDFLLMLGANPWESNGSLWTAPDLPGRLRALRERGGRLVVIDPRRTRTAQHADEHHPIRPGTDALWLLALAQVLLEEGRAAPGRLAAFTAGLEATPALLAPYTPEAVAPRCGIDANTTRRLARELAAAGAAAVYGRIGVHAQRFGTLAAWATELLNLLTGNLDRAGGVMFPRAAHARLRAEAPGGRGFRTGRWRSRVRGLPEVRSEFPVATLADEIETPGEGQLRALLTVGGNPVLSTPNGARLDRALGSLEFMVSVDLYLNETTRHAHVILPPPSPLERSHYDLTFYRAAVRHVANYSEAIFPAAGPSEAEILARLALIAAGKGAGADPAAVDDEVLGGFIESEVANPHSPIAGRDPAPIRALLEGETPCDQIVDFLLRTGPYGEGFGVDTEGLSLAALRARPHGVDLGPLGSRLPGLLETRSGKIELLPEAVTRDLERLRAELDAPAPANDLILIGRRDLRSNNSWMHNLPSLMSGRERCTLRMHPQDAGRLELSDGTRVRIRSRVAELEVSLELTDAIAPGVVSLPHGYGHDFAGAQLAVARSHCGVSANHLTEGEMDEPSGNAVLNGVPVTVQAA